MLAEQPANWDRRAAFPIMQAWLAKFGASIRGVWAANDDMALGALEALRAAGLAGRIPVVGVDGIPEAIAAIGRGELTATVSSDAFYQGSIGLAMGVCVLTGQAPPPRPMDEGAARVLPAHGRHHTGERRALRERACGRELRGANGAATSCGAR